MFLTHTSVHHSASFQVFRIQFVDVHITKKLTIKPWAKYLQFSFQNSVQRFYISCAYKTLPINYSKCIYYPALSLRTQCVEMCILPGHYDSIISLVLKTNV